MSLIHSIAILWLVYLAGMATHMSLALLPLLSGFDVTEDSMKGRLPIKEKWMLMFFTIIPMLIIGVIFLTDHVTIRWANLIFSIVFTFMNFMHLLQHLKARPIDNAQNILLGVLALLSLELNYLSYNWVFSS
ncbi:MAG: hypothetical protein JJ964_14320 [Rhizobiales bacterium]|nr:hypothetical protein [Hyphomicrobiales bacterium]